MRGCGRREGRRRSEGVGARVSVAPTPPFTRMSPPSPGTPRPCTTASNCPLGCPRITHPRASSGPGHRARVGRGFWRLRRTSDPVRGPPSRAPRRSPFAPRGSRKRVAHRGPVRARPAPPVSKPIAPHARNHASQASLGADARPAADCRRCPHAPQLLLPARQRAVRACVQFDLSARGAHPGHPRTAPGERGARRPRVRRGARSSVGAAARARPAPAEAEEGG